MQSETVLSILNLNRKEWNKKNIATVFQNATLFTNHMVICANTPVVSGTIWCSWEVLCSAAKPWEEYIKTICSFHTDCFSTSANPRHPFCRDSKWTLIHRNALISSGSGPGRRLNTALLLDWPVSLPHLHTSIHGIYNSKGLESPMLPLVPLHTRSFFFIGNRRRKTTTVREKNVVMSLVLALKQWSRQVQGRPLSHCCRDFWATAAVPYAN